MRIAYLCLDPGIPVFGTKGASVHIQEVIRRFRADGHEVVVHAVRVGEHRPADLAELKVVEHRIGRGDPALRERRQREVSSLIANAVIATGCDLVYERYSLFSTALASVTGTLGVPGVLEVNAPLIDEQRRHRHLVDESGASDALAAQARAAARVVCVSQPVADWVRRRTGVDAAVVPNGVNTERIRPGVRAARPVVAFVGTLKPWHGVEILLRAAALAQTGWSVRVIGDGPERASLQALAGGLDVEFTGAVPPDQIPALLTDAWLAAAPYPTSDDHYFSPLKVLEYAAAGLPIVASRIGQLPALIEDGRTGLLVPPSDPAALAEAIDTLVGDPERLSSMAREIRSDAERRFDWSHVVDASLTGLIDRPLEVAHG